MSAIDFVRDIPTRETLKDHENRLSAAEGNIGLVVQNRTLTLQAGGVTMVLSAVAPSVPDEGTTLWFKPAASGANTIYIATGTSRTREWLWLAEST